MYVDREEAADKQQKEWPPGVSKPKMTGTKEKEEGTGTSRPAGKRETRGKKAPKGVKAEEMKPQYPKRAVRAEEPG